jgi:FtsP/CotA-like multicopper oxidase with cupredoxin domain
MLGSPSGDSKGSSDPSRGSSGPSAPDALRDRSDATQPPRQFRRETLASPSRFERAYLGRIRLVAPGERIDVIVDATEVGTWAYHCHILTHAEGRNGMFGMVTALIVEE